MPGLVSKAAYARHRGVTRQAVDYALKVQRITAEPDGRIDVAKADAAWLANTHPIHGGVRIVHGRAAGAGTRTARAGSRGPRAKSRPAPAAAPQSDAPDRASTLPPDPAAQPRAGGGSLPVLPTDPRPEAAAPEVSAAGGGADAELPKSSSEIEGEGDSRSGLIDAKTKREEWAAKLTEMDYRKRAGELVEADQVRRVLTEGARAVRDALLSIPPRVCRVLAPEQTPAEVKAILEDEITKALDGLVKSMEKLGAA